MPRRKYVRIYKEENDRQIFDLLKQNPCISLTDCPFCGHNHVKRLILLPVPDVPYGWYVCAKCDRYLGAIADPSHYAAFIARVAAVTNFANEGYTIRRLACVQKLFDDLATVVHPTEEMRNRWNASLQGRYSILLSPDSSVCI